MIKKLMTARSLLAAGLLSVIGIVGVTNVNAQQPIAVSLNLGADAPDGSNGDGFLWKQTKNHVNKFYSKKMLAANPAFVYLNPHNVLVIIYLDEKLFFFEKV